MTLHRRRLLTASAALLVAPSLGANTARAQSAPIRWRCVTSWARNMPGPGVTARRLAERIKSLSDGALLIEVFAAGEIVPGFQVFDAVSQGNVEMAHTASLFWGGKMPAAPLFTTQPFGLGPTEHMAWLAADGQSLWDALYAPFNIKPLVAGNTGPSAAGWFKRDIQTLDDLKGLRIRSTGLGGEVYANLGATPIAIPPADTYAALERGVIDAVELLAPANDLPLGLQRIAPYYVFPGFNKPNGASEALIGLRPWQSLSPTLQAVVEAACRVEHDLALAEAFTANVRALAQLKAASVKLIRLPSEALARAELASAAVLDRIAGTSPEAKRIVGSFSDYRAASSPWRALTG